GMACRLGRQARSTIDGEKVRSSVTSAIMLAVVSSFQYFVASRELTERFLGHEVVGYLREHLLNLVHFQMLLVLLVFSYGFLFGQHLFESFQIFPGSLSAL